MKKVINLFLILLSYIILVIVFPMFFVKYQEGIGNITGDKLTSLTNSNPLNFEFTSNKPWLSKLSLSLKNPSLYNHSPITITISSPHEDRQINLSGFNIGDPSNLELEFIPFKETANTTYKINVSTKNTDDQQLYIYKDNTNIPVFRTFYSPQTLNDKFFNSITSYYQSIINRPLKYNFIYFSTISVLVFFYIWL